MNITLEPQTEVRTLNVELLRKIQNDIRTNPDSFDMTDYVHRHPCGTTFCIAGLAGHFSGLDEEDIINLRDPADYQGGLLGLYGYSEYKTLFYEDEWAPQFSQKYRYAQCNAERAEVAVAYINYFIDNYTARVR
jgi:hypothetical protein